MTPTSSQLLSECVRAKSVANPTPRSPVTNYLSAMEGSFCCVVDIVRFLFSHIVVVVVLPKLCALPTLTKDKITKILQLSEYFKYKVSASTILALCLLGFSSLPYRPRAPPAHLFVHSALDRPRHIFSFSLVSFSCNTLPSRRTLKNSRLVCKKDDVHVCIMCLRAIMNYQVGELPARSSI